MLPQICAGSPKAMQQVDFVQSNEPLLFERKMLLCFSAILWAFATREESQRYIFLFSVPCLCPQSNVQVSTADNL